MARVLIIHHDKAMRSHLEMLARLRYDVDVAPNVDAGAKQIARSKPDMIVIGSDSKKNEAERLLRWMRDNILKLPVAVIFAGGAGRYQPLLMKLGAKGFAEAPVDQTAFDKALATAVRRHEDLQKPPPPMHRHELKHNLSMLETKLNEKMKCFAGKNQVYLQSMILGGTTSKPRICLKCSLRGEYGLNRDVYYKWIRDVCCKRPALCTAYRMFQEARESA